MRFSNLVERVVPLVAELFATLASRDPLRMYFADIAGKTLLDIVGVLRADGISQEAIAASLDLTIEGFRSKVKRLREAHEPATTATGLPAEPRTLLERVYEYVQDEGQTGVRYREIASHFRGVKPDSLKGVLHFLVRSSLLSVSGRGPDKEYFVVPTRRAESATRFDASVTLYRDGPMSLAELAARLELDVEVCQGFVEELDDQGHIERTGGDDGEVLLRATTYHVPVDSSSGYEAALWDHLQAVVRSVCKKVRLGRYAASLHDINGGTTFSFDLVESGALYDEVVTFLAEMRTRMERWRQLALEEADDHGLGATHRVTLYTGQMVERLHDEP